MFMSERENRAARIGYSSFFVVATLGLILALTDANVGIGISGRLPYTETNITLAGSLGHKSKAKETLPGYVADELGGNTNFINSNESLTLGSAEGTGIFVAGKQKGSPGIIGLHFKIRHDKN